MDHPDNTSVRSAVGLLVGVGWVMDVVDAIEIRWDGDPDRCTYPTGMDRNYPSPNRNPRKPPTNQGPRNVPWNNGPPR